MEVKQKERKKDEIENLDSFKKAWSYFKRYSYVQLP